MDFEAIITQANPSQSHWELGQLLKILVTEDIHSVLEIGVHRGGSLRVWRDIFKPDNLVGIDGKVLPEANMSGAFIFEGMSQEKQIYDRVVTSQLGHKFDFIFIDGGHLYNEVKADFELYSPLVRPGGMIGFHDVVIRDNSMAEVYKLWDELKVNHKTITIWDGTPTGTGEGLLWI